MNGFTIQQARHLAVAHRQCIRRAAWEDGRYLYYSEGLRLWVTQREDVVAEAQLRVCLAEDVTAADLLARDWTNVHTYPLRDKDDQQLYGRIPEIPADVWGGPGNPTGQRGMGYGTPGTPAVELVVLYTPPVDTPLINYPQGPETPGTPPTPAAPTITYSGALVHRYGQAGDVNGAHYLSSVGGTACYLVDPSNPEYLETHNTQGLGITVTVAGGPAAIGVAWVEFSYRKSNGNSAPSTGHFESGQQTIGPGQSVTWTGLAAYEMLMQPGNTLSGTIHYYVGGTFFSQPFTVPQIPFCSAL